MGVSEIMHEIVYGSKYNRIKPFILRRNGHGRYVCNICGLGGFTARGLELHSRCGAVLAEYNPKTYIGIISVDYYTGKKCPKCGYEFKGIAKTIKVDGKTIYPT